MVSYREKRRAVIALGGNAIIRANEQGTIADQFRNTRMSLTGVVDMIRDGWDTLITHGNGPQVGNRLVSNEMAHQMVPDIPLGVLCGDTEGAMGYMIQQSLYNKLIYHSIRCPVVTVITQTVVDAHDMSRNNPTKPIGLFFSEEEAGRIMKERGWTFMEDAGRGYRQVVPSPYPLQIIEIDVIRRLLDSGVVVVAVGGGGVPVVRLPDGTLDGIDGIIDKDLASSLAARELSASRFVMVTGVDNVYVNFRKPNRKPLGRVGLGDLMRYRDAGEFPIGSMGPKIRAAIEFLEARPDGEVIITSPEKLYAALEGWGGTVIYNDDG
ncbi:MAG: carbamate kinase [Deltaproteobacteria bacterium]|nr:carbamate kinase [Candidatus Zymogenaceae bacterium]